MKLFSIVHEGDRLSDSWITLKLPRKDKRVLNKVKRPFYFDLHLTTKFNKVHPDVPVIIRRRLAYKTPFSFKYYKICYLNDYSFLHDPKSNLDGFLKEKDIHKDAGICIWGEVETKEFTIKEE